MRVAGDASECFRCPHLKPCQEDDNARCIYDKIDYASEILGFCDLFEERTGEKPTLISMNHHTYTDLANQCMNKMGDAPLKCFLNKAKTITVINGIPLDITYERSDNEIGLLSQNRDQAVYKIDVLLPTAIRVREVIKFADKLRTIELEE